MFNVASVARHNETIVFFIHNAGYLRFAGVNPSFSYRVSIQLINLKYRDVAILFCALFIFRKLAFFKELTGNEDKKFAIRLLLAYIHCDG